MSAAGAGFCEIGFGRSNPRTKIMSYRPTRHSLLTVRCQLVFLLLLASACDAQRVPPKHLVGVVRDAHEGKLLRNVDVQLRQGEHVLDNKTTGSLGLFSFDLKQLSKEQGTCCNDLVVRVTPKDGSHLPAEQRWSPYLGLMDVRLGPAPVRPKMADMHYHLSLRGHNLHANHLYGTDTLNGRNQAMWFKDQSKLKVLDDGKWRKVPSVQLWRWANKEDDAGGKNTRNRIEQLLLGTFVRPKSQNNKVIHYTQATYPHLFAGNVHLAYNSISPLEHGLQRRGLVRWVSSCIKTGVPPAWLKRIGWARSVEPLTHWRNFRLEHATLQLQAEKDRTWRFIDHAGQLGDDDTLPAVLAVLEGGHTLQDRFFPHKVGYNMEQRTHRQDHELARALVGQKLDATPWKIKELLRAVEKVDSGVVALERHRAREFRRQSKDQRAVPKIEAKDKTVLRKEMNELLDSLSKQRTGLVDSVLRWEVLANIDTLKHYLPTPKIRMVTVAHLGYNGMMGHAPALDDGGRFANLIARRVYNTRVSEDPSYKRAWSDLFFTVPGPNKFGRAVMEALVGAPGSSRIQIDLKHSDFITRQYFYRNLMSDSVPPICSHCAASGLPEEYYSPITDEYSLLRAGTADPFYPFGINLYDEEIEKIKEYGGIIGIPLEQRVLGGYIKHGVRAQLRLRRDGSENVSRRRQGSVRRWSYLKRYCRYLDAHRDTAWQRALDYTSQTMAVSDVKDARELTYQDLRSSEPFLQNLFHMVDIMHSDTTPLSPWKHLCLGTDLDGVIDPLDICPTADQLPHFKERLRQFIPVFLQMREHTTPGSKPYSHYFPSGVADLTYALDQLFYQSLHDFTRRYF
jgi:hypothetical protein